MLSPFSNMYPAAMEIGGNHYHLVEHYYTHQMAKYANNFSTARKILTSKDGKEAKFYANGLELDRKVWTEKKGQLVMKIGVTEKFRQNPDLLKHLADTRGYTLAECNMHDSTWSTGLSMKDPDAQIISKWKGRNLMGKILGEVREQLMSS